MEDGEKSHFHDEFFVLTHEQRRVGVVRQGTTVIQKNNPKVNIDTTREGGHLVARSGCIQFHGS